MTDGISLVVLGKTEKRLGVRLPVSLREYYLCVGKLELLKLPHHKHYDHAELRVEDGHLLFMEEKQRSVHWGIRVQDVAVDPEVWQRVRSKPPEWRSERLTFFNFILHLHDRQTGHGQA